MPARTTLCPMVLIAPGPDVRLWLSLAGIPDAGDEPRLDSYRPGTRASACRLHALVVPGAQD
jgi:hypothetical protein